MERLSDLFFELSHENRLEILGMLMTGPTKLTHIAVKMDNSSQEAHRHLSRLLDAGLVTKTPEGDYKITSYGSQVMRLVPGYDFLTKNSEYFMTRDTSLIPDRFMARVGELSESVLVNDVLVTLFDLEVMIKESEEYACIMINQMVMNLYKPILAASDRGVTIKVIRPRGWQLPDDVAEKIDRETLMEAFQRVELGKITQKETEVLPAFMAYSEKQVAALSFARLDGGIDYLGFKADDEKASSWCHELFDYIWDRASRADIDPVRARHLLSLERRPSDAP